MAEQLNFNFEMKDEKPPQKAVEAQPPHEYDFAESEDCPRCMTLKSLGTCSLCLKYQKKMSSEKKQ